MKARDVWDLTPAEIRTKLEDTHAELFNLRFQYATGQLKNTARLSEVRREIARLRTVLREGELAAVQGE